MAPGPRRPGKVEHEYRRGGTLAYLAAIDVYDRARGLFGRVEPKLSDRGFGALVEDVLSTEPYERCAMASRIGLGHDTRTGGR